MIHRCSSQDRQTSGTPQGQVPPWRQLYALLRGQIEDGTLPPGGRLPSIADLSQQYGLAMTTVRKAVDQLKRDTLVVASPMGTFVAELGTSGD